LGPPGTYSHLAALRHFGSSVELEDLHDITGVFEEVMRGHVQYAIVPVENTIGGGVVETLDAFRDAIFHAGRTDVSVCAEVQLAVRHNFLCNGLPKRVTRIYSKPEALTQCKVWLARQFPQAELVAMPSTSKAAEFVAQQSLEAHKAGKEIDCAAIGSELAGTLTGLHVLFEGVEDHPGNVTRFLVLSRQRTPATGDDKTSVMFDLSDRPGSLVHVLEAFARQNINLTHIEKRPSGRKNWTYTFFVDAQGHREDPAVDAALSVAKMHCKDLSVLGSYPRSKRVL
jgi:chorismate mutase/prephenate dehydratase